MATYHGAVLTVEDALLLFEATRINCLPLCHRRLSDDERHLVKSGAVFIWDELQSGIRRWTDGKTWSASRVQGHFLTYRELEPRSASQQSTDMESNTNDDPRRQRFKEYGLIKKGISLLRLDGRKMHLVAYFDPRDIKDGKLMRPNDDNTLKNVDIKLDLYPVATSTSYASNDKDTSAYSRFNASATKSAVPLYDPSHTSVYPQNTAFSPVVVKTPSSQEPFKGEHSGMTTVNFSPPYNEAGSASRYQPYSLNLVSPNNRMRSAVNAVRSRSRRLSLGPGNTRMAVNRVLSAGGYVTPPLLESNNVSPVKSGRTNASPRLKLALDLSNLNAKQLYASDGKNVILPPPKGGFGSGPDHWNANPTPRTQEDDRIVKLFRF